MTNPNTPPAPPGDDDPGDRLRMARVAAGDRAALAELVQRHHERVWRLAYRCARQREEAEDIAQDAFVRLWRAAGRYQPTARFTTWLYRIVINLCLDAKRRRGRQPLRLADAPEAQASEQQRDAMVEDEMVRRVRQAIDQLPERQRTALVLHRYQDLSHQQIAEATGWSVKAVESLLVRAYAALRQSLADWEQS